MTGDKWQMAVHGALTVLSLVAVLLLVAWHDVSGQVALYVILALTGVSGSQAMAALTVPASFARQVARRPDSSRGMGQGG